MGAQCVAPLGRAVRMNLVMNEACMLQQGGLAASALSSAPLRADVAGRSTTCTALALALFACLPIYAR